MINTMGEDERALMLGATFAKELIKKISFAAQKYSRHEGFQSKVMATTIGIALGSWFIGLSQEFSSKRAEDWLAEVFRAATKTLKMNGVLLDFAFRQPVKDE